MKTTEFGGAGHANDMILSQGSEFEWDDSIQGYLLSAFAVGHIVGNISGGFFCSIFGGKLYMSVTMAFIGLFQLASPFAARLSPWFLYALRVLFGACVSRIGK